VSAEPLETTSRVDWHVYRGTGRPGVVKKLPDPPPWRRFDGEPVCPAPAEDRGDTDRRIGGVPGVVWIPSPHEVAMVNAAIYLRRPLLVTGKPGTGKSSLTYLVGHDVGLGPVLLPYERPRVLLIDELNKSDVALPNGRLNVLGAMVAAQFGDTDGVDTSRLIAEFLARSEETGGLASDQLLNAVHLALELATSGAYQPDEDWQNLLEAIWHPLTSTSEAG
jgi:hypothetical protein